MTQNSERNTREWPKHYVARFPAKRSAARTVAVIVTILTMTGSWRRCLISGGLLVAALALGALIARAENFASGWQFYAALPLLILVAGVAYGIAQTAQRLRGLYEPGSLGEIVVKDGKFLARLNGKIFAYDVADVRTIRRFGSMSAVVFPRVKAVVVPTRWVPHHIPGTHREGSPF